MVVKGGAGRKSQSGMAVVLKGGIERRPAGKRSE